ncbi:MAG: hypothetical protein HPY50_07655 [Firmicutes bacterium]|nr:hypothetical protein [Bacillota bacterium]
MLSVETMSKLKEMEIEFHPVNEKQGLPRLDQLLISIEAEDYSWRLSRIEDAKPLYLCDVSHRHRGGFVKSILADTPEEAAGKILLMIHQNKGH